MTAACPTPQAMVASTRPRQVCAACACRERSQGDVKARPGLLCARLSQGVKPLLLTQISPKTGVK